MKTLTEIYYNNESLRSPDNGGDKGTAHSYIKTYDSIFKQYQDKDINILEIGIYEGQSLALWEKYFTPNSKIYGVDINKNCKQYEKNNIYVLIGDATDGTFIDNTFKDIKFDIIIDDGSHIREDQLISFKILFSKYLNEGGTYIIEDINSLDNHQSDFENLHSSCHIIDTRQIQKRWDDILAIYNK
jgi:23S rRNA U2552 (ribose-2'-O)-methylase RlmE/FtsJ